MYLYKSKLKKSTFIFIIFLIFFSGYFLGLKTKFQFKVVFYQLTKKFVNRIKIAKYKVVNCPKESIQIAYFGQSNSANYVVPLADTKIPKNLLQYDWNTKSCYEYKEPLLGTNGENGNVITYAAKQIAQNTNKKVVIIPFGVSGSSILDWAYGPLSYLNQIVLNGLKENSLYPQVFLWHQGESDSRLNNADPKKMINSPNFSLDRSIRLGLSYKDYKNSLQILVDQTKEYFPESFFGIALTSRCNSKEWDPVRKAQADIVKENFKTFISVDSDKVYFKNFRYDNCHFSSIGAKKISEDFYKSITQKINFKFIKD